LRTALAFTVLVAASGCKPCGGGGACELPGGRYFALPPEGWDGQTALPTLVHVHAWNSDTSRWRNDDSFVQTFSDAGMMVLLPEGIGENWNAQRDPDERDDVSFIATVVDDASARFPIDDARIYASGHSVGAAVVHRMACEDGDRYRAFGPLAGAFWIPAPTDCPSGPVAMLDIHGTADTTWPMDGRSFGDMGGQEAVLDTIDFWRAHDGCAEADGTAGSRQGWSCERWSCEGELELCLHSGLHAAPDGWMEEHLAFYREHGLHGAP
jgi:polyhydroxybutyrate depolymerase